MGTLSQKVMSLFSSCAALGLLSCSSIAEVPQASSSAATPASVFDLSKWNLTVPLDTDGNESADVISTEALMSYRHSNFFYINAEGHLVFATPNKATTTPNSTNTRSELRQMIRGSDTSKNTHSLENNFVLNSHPMSDRAPAIGGRLEATLKVDHVARRAQIKTKKPTYSVVVGQIHAVKLADHPVEYGWGNEPLKISFKKWPDHDYGSVYWAYERNLPKDDPNRTDIAYPVWGNTWDSEAAPGQAGIKLGETFSYTVDVSGNVMDLIFKTERHGTTEYKINLANNVDANGEPDTVDNPYGYSGDLMYFKAGAYNQCSSKQQDGFWYPGCSGTGDWETDKANGDYAQVTFEKLSVTGKTNIIDEYNSQTADLNKPTLSIVR